MFKQVWQITMVDLAAALSISRTSQIRRYHTNEMYLDLNNTCKAMMLLKECFV